MSRVLMGTLVSLMAWASAVVLSALAQWPTLVTQLAEGRAAVKIETAVAMLAAALAVLLLDRWPRLARALSVGVGGISLVILCGYMFVWPLDPAGPRMSVLTALCLFLVPCALGAIEHGFPTLAGLAALAGVMLACAGLYAYTAALVNSPLGVSTGMAPQTALALVILFAVVLSINERAYGRQQRLE